MLMLCVQGVCHMVLHDCPRHASTVVGGGWPYHQIEIFTVRLVRGVPIQCELSEMFLCSDSFISEK